jgi:hypothetical protein
MTRTRPSRHRWRFNFLDRITELTKFNFENSV